MKIDLKNLNDADIKTTGGKEIKMKLSDKAQSFIFQMFSGDMYQNPIGSIVREITSNCFDSHIEAGTENPDNPVIIKHTYDKAAKEHFISFFDKGMGMSPDRIENIYGVYFESTKRDGNDQIGGFGIGGKSPLAYTNSFGCITRYNGIEYQYTIFNGTEAPGIKELFQTSTTEANGTEIRIPVKEMDLLKFASEIKRQLYYFENIIYQGFDDDDELNSYNIYKGKNFLYRGNTYESTIHVCLGKVAYPISYSDLGLSYYDYCFPLALKFNIGDIKVTPNRENLQYNDATIKVIKEKIELVKAELGEMISKQYENVHTLMEYYFAKENFGELTFPNKTTMNIKGLIKKKDINYTNFKYKDLPFIPTSESVVNLFYNVHEYGKAKGWSARSINIKLGSNNSTDKIYHCPNEFKRKIVKQAYLNYVHDKNFVIMKPYQIFGDDNVRKLEAIKLAFGCTEEDKTLFTMNNVISAKKAERLLKGFHKELKAWVAKLFDSYDEIDVPQDFIDARKMEKLSKEILKTTIPLRNNGGSGYKSRVSIENIMKFKGRIFYGDTSKEDIVRDGSNIYQSMFGTKKLDGVTGYGRGFDKGKGVAFVSCATTNIKFLKMCPNAYHIDLLYPILLRRKMINPANIEAATKFVNRYSDLSELYKGNFGKINTKVVRYKIEVEKEVEELKKYSRYSNINFDHYLITKYVNINTKAKKTLVIKTTKKLDYLLKIDAKNKDIINWFNLPYMYYNEGVKFEDKHDGLVALLKKVMVF